MTWWYQNEDAVEEAEEVIEKMVDRRLQSLFAAVLADPDVTPDAKSLAGWMLERVSPTGGFGDAERELKAGSE